MMDYTRDAIAAEARRIKQKLMDGKLYGEPINIGDFNLTIVAAYYLGLAEAENSYVRFGKWTDDDK